MDRDKDSNSVVVTGKGLGVRYGIAREEEAGRGGKWN